MVWAEGEEPGGNPTPTCITTADQLKTALTGKHSDEPITVTLAANIGISETIELTNKNTITLDLAGFTITATDHRALWVKNGSLTIQSTGTEGRIYVVGTIDSDQSVIRVGYGAKDGSEIAEPVSLSIDENVTISTDLCYGVTIFGKNTSQTLDVDGKISTKVSPAISGNGDFIGTTITIGEKAEISTTDVVAIYHPQGGDLTVNGKVTGAGGIEMKGGTIEVGETAKISATEATPTHAPKNNDPSTKGYAIAIVENGEYAGVSTVNISKDATIVGPVSVVKDSDKKPESPVITFDPSGLQMSVKVESDGKSFGQYQTLAEAFKDAPTGGTVTLLDNCSLSSTIETTKDLTLALNGHNITSNGQRAFHVKSGTVSITTPSGQDATIEAKGAIDANSSVIHLGDDEGNDKTVSLNIGAGVTVKTNACHGVTAYGSATTETLTVAGKIETDGYPAISGKKSDNAVVTVEAGAEITATNAVAIYHPQNEALTVNGKVTGAGGIEIKAGTLTVGGSTAEIAKTGTPSHTVNNDGTSSTGYAIAIVENTNFGKVTSVNIDNEANITGIVAELQDSPVDGFAPSYSGTKVTKKIAAINNDKYFSLNDAISVVPATETVKLLAAYTTTSTYVMSAEKTYTLDLNGYDFTGTNCAAIQIAGGHVTIKNSGDADKKVIVSGTTTDPVLKLGSSDVNITNNRNVSLTIDETAIVDGSDITSGILLEGNKTRETLIVKGKVTTTNHIAILGTKGYNGTTIQIDGGTVTATNAVAIYHPQSGDLIIEGRKRTDNDVMIPSTISGSGAIEMKGGDLTITKDATITATALELAHTASDVAPSTNGYAIALVEHKGFTGVGKVNISNQASAPGVIACLVDLKNNAVAAPVFNGDVQMVAETSGSGNKYASLPNAITACAAGGEVKFLDDINITEGFTINNSLTIDMDDYTIINKHTSDYAITIDVTGDGNNVILKNGGVTIEKDATVTNNGIKVVAGTVALQQVIVSTKGVSLNVESGTVTIDAKSSFSSSADNTLALSGGTTTLSGKVYNTSETDGKKNAIAGTSDAVLTAENTIVVSSANGNGIDWGSSGALSALTVKGGKVMGAEAVHVNAGAGNVTIEGGTFTGTGNALNVAGGTPSVTGGTYICGSDNQYAPITATSGINGFVSGNTTYFSKKIAQELCTTGYMVSTNPKTNGYYYLIDEIIINDATAWTKPESAYTIHTAKYVRNSGMGANGTKFGTLCLPFTFNANVATGIPTGMKFYKVVSINDAKSEITISQLSSDITAGTPVIFEFENSTSNFTIESTNAAFPASYTHVDNNLVGTLVGTTLTTTTSDAVSQVYYLSGDAFHKAKETLTVPAFRAYIKIETSSFARTLYIHTDNDTTDIDDVLLDDEVEGVYDIQGRKQNGLQNGMNIMKMSNGKTIKVIVNK